jgi:hypothetical protein
LDTLEEREQPVSGLPLKVAQVVKKLITGGRVKEAKKLLKKFGVSDINLTKVRRVPKTKVIHPGHYRPRNLEEALKAAETSTKNLYKKPK